MIVNVDRTVLQVSFDWGGCSLAQSGWPDCNCIRTSLVGEPTHFPFKLNGVKLQKEQQQQQQQNQTPANWKTLLEWNSPWHLSFKRKRQTTRGN